MCGTQSARFWIVIRLPTSSRSRFANIAATKLRRRSCTDRYRLCRCCPRKRRHFAASEGPGQTIAFQGREGAKLTIIPQNCGEVGEKHVNHQMLFKQEDSCPHLRAGCYPAVNYAERFRIRANRKARARS